MITHKKYLEAQKIVDAYHLQSKQSVISTSDLSVNQKVKRNYSESRDYWVTEIQGEDVLIRTTENEDDPNYDDFLVNVAELRLV